MLFDKNWGAVRLPLLHYTELISYYIHKHHIRRIAIQLPHILQVVDLVQVQAFIAVEPVLDDCVFVYTVDYGIRDGLWTAGEDNYFVMPSYFGQKVVQARSYLNIHFDIGSLPVDCGCEIESWDFMATWENKCTFQFKYQSFSFLF